MTEMTATDRSARYRKRHGKRVRIKARERYWKNREKELERMRRWRDANAEYFAEYAKTETFRVSQHRYYQQNRSAILAKRRAHQKANPEKRREAMRRWRANNPEAFVVQNRANAHRRKARPGIEFSLTLDDWAALLSLFENHCAYCGEADGSLTQDHVLPLSRGGAHSLENVVPACLSCNSSKGARTPEEWPPS